MSLISAGSISLDSTFKHLRFPNIIFQELLEMEEEARFLGTFNLAWVNSTFLYPYFLKVRK
jgi:hypothetical protein